MYRAQRIDGNNGVIYLVFMFTPRVYFKIYFEVYFKISKIVIFFVFSAENSKKFVTVWAIYLSTHGKILLSSCRKWYG